MRFSDKWRRGHLHARPPPARPPGGALPAQGGLQELDRHPVVPPGVLHQFLVPQPVLLLQVRGPPVRQTRLQLARPRPRQDTGP